MPKRFLLPLQLKLLHDVPVPLCHNFLTGLNRLEIIYSYGSLQINGEINKGPTKP